MRLGWVLGAWLLVACGDNIVMRYDEFGDAYVDARCRFQLRCGVLASASECELFFSRKHYPGLMEAVEAGATDFDPEAAHECIEWLDSLSCDPTTAAWRAPHCFGIWNGTRRDGEACARDEECVSGECWYEDTSSTCTDACCFGYCVGNDRPTIGTVGDRCRYSTCDQGYCDGSVCVPLLGAAAPCDTTSQCEIGLSCSNGMCQALPAAGEACSGACRDVGQMCNAITGVCEQVRTRDQPCYAESDCSSFYHCSSLVKDGRCQVIGEGDRCGLPGYGVCPLPLACKWFGTTCITPAPVGAPCQSGDECDSGICNVIAHVCTDVPCI